MVFHGSIEKPFIRICCNSDQDVKSVSHEGASTRAALSAGRWPLGNSLSALFHRFTTLELYHHLSEISAGCTQERKRRAPKTYSRNAHRAEPKRKLYAAIAHENYRSLFWIKSVDFARSETEAPSDENQLKRARAQDFSAECKTLLATRTEGKTGFGCVRVTAAARHRVRTKLCMACT